MKLSRQLLASLLTFSLGALAAAAPPVRTPAPCASGEELVETPPGEVALLSRIVELGREESRVQEHLRTLTRRYGPRLTGSPVLEQAELWAMRTFESFGLEARREAWGEFPVGFWRGPARGRVLAPEERELVFCTPAWSGGTIGPVRGPAVLEPTTTEELEALRPRLRGAWVLRPRAAREGGREPEGQSSDEAREARRRARELADAFDAACTEAGIAGRVGPGSSDGRVLTSGNYRIDPADLPDELRITLRNDQFDEIAAWVRAGTQVELEFDIDNRFLPGPVQNYNVVADLVGRELPDEFVIVQAHIDSWDGAEGACDNGTGVATTLEAARLLAEAGVRPRRTIRFVLYSGEEQGLLGSRGYVRDHADELACTSVVLNHDEGTNYLKGIQATPAMRATFERVFAPVETLDPLRPFEIVPVASLGSFGGSDHASFVVAGVPAFHWIQAGEGYTHVHHTQYDTFDAAIEEEQQHSALVVALAAYGFAELDGLIDRTNMTAPPPRRMGVMLEGTRVTSVTPGGRGAEAGWLEGDAVVSIDGVEVSTRDAVVAELQKGGPKKTFVLKRGDQTVETVLDYSNESDAPGAEGRGSERESSQTPALPGARERRPQ